MDFIIYFDYDQCGYSSWETPKEQPYPEAFQRTVRFRETWVQRPQFMQTIRAALSSEGKPILKKTMKKVWGPTLPKRWRRTGSNHTFDEAENIRIYRRESERQEWFVSFDTLEAFVEFCHKRGAELVDPDTDLCEPYPILHVY